MSWPHGKCSFFSSFYAVAICSTKRIRSLTMFHNKARPEKFTLHNKRVSIHREVEAVYTETPRGWLPKYNRGSSARDDSLPLTSGKVDYGAEFIKLRRGHHFARTVDFLKWHFGFSVLFQFCKNRVCCGRIQKTRAAIKQTHELLDAALKKARRYIVLCCLWCNIYYHWRVVKRLYVHHL